MEVEPDAIRIVDLVVAEELRRKRVARVMLNELATLAATMKREWLVAAVAHREFLEHVGFHEADGVMKRRVGWKVERSQKAGIAHRCWCFCFGLDPSALHACTGSKPEVPPPPPPIPAPPLEPAPAPVVEPVKLPTLDEVRSLRTNNQLDLYEAV